MSPPGPAPGSTSTLRSANQQRVLDVLRGRLDPPSGLEHATASSGGCDDPAGGFTQAELARLTGLAPATVSNIVRDLSGSGLLVTDPGSGRRGSSVRLSPEAGIVAGIDFGHSHVAVGVATVGGRLLGEQRRALDTHDASEALSVATRMLDDLAAGRPALRQVGLGVPAPLTHGQILSSSVFPGWEGLDVAAVAERALGTPVAVENDANLGALAEHRVGVARGLDSSVFVKISSGVGAGIVIRDEIFHGSGGTAGEIGHLTLDEQGPVCRCGSRGCLEAYASTGTVLDLMSVQLPGAMLRDVIAAANEGNPAAQRVFEDAGSHLGWGLASIVNLLNPAAVVVGGDMAGAGDLLLDATRRSLRRHALDSVAHTPVLASALGERASIVGACLLAAETVDLVADAG